MKSVPNVQSFRIFDALRCILWNGPRGLNLACPSPLSTGARDNFPFAAGLWRNAALRPRNRVTLVQWERGELAGLVSAKPRSGPGAWDIDGLYLPSVVGETGDLPDHVQDNSDETECSEAFEVGHLALLEELFVAVGERAGERLFLRMASGSPALAMARRSGFSVVGGETLVVGPGAPRSNSIDERPTDQFGFPGLRPRLPADDIGVFHLYCASVPVRVRQAVGLTFDQWQDARLPQRGGLLPSRHREWVVDQSDRIVGWLRLDGQGRPPWAEVMAHPDCPETLARLVDFASCQARGLRWLLPDHQVSVGDRLQWLGGGRVAEYTMLVKMVAVPSVQYGMAPVEA